MLEIMAIEDSFLLAGKGSVVSGVNAKLDGESSGRIRELIGNRVRIFSADGGGLDFEVKDIGVSESLVGKKNITILLESSDLANFARGSRVFAL